MIILLSDFKTLLEVFEKKIQCSAVVLRGCAENNVNTAMEFQDGLQKKTVRDIIEVFYWSVLYFTSNINSVEFCVIHSWSRNTTGSYEKAQLIPKLLCRS